ncbi:hypothetical protein E1283_07670 [Streptomyces hainanensis]|uniref:CU044_5270 family protein n=2 Tax=Streptomyces hainanensis TaxID=402648 RepID=A0A4R4TI98_9ACTN|nr:hypothetical protein E1283_07670 [Streptomyces hainanensis]
MSEIRSADARDRRPAGTRRRLWAAVAIPAVAGSLALALFAGGVLSEEDAPPAPPAPGAAESTWAFVADVDAVSADGGADLLRDVARAAAASQGDVRDDQFVYVRSLASYLTEEIGDEEGPIVLQPAHEREVWFSVDGSRDGLLREPEGSTEDTPLDAHPESSYRGYGQLPTDAEAMLEWLYGQQDEGDEERDVDQDAFVAVGDIVRESLLPPDVGAALYEAVALIPDVLLVPDAVTADGRHGVAVARVDSYNPREREELIFDEETLEYIGSRSVAVEDFAGVEEGTVLGTTAVLERGVVDGAGDRP